MKTHMRALTVLAVVALLAGCAGAPPRPVLLGFEELPIPDGMAYVADRSTVIDSPTIKMQRTVYRGRFEMESTGAALRKGLEAKGWRHVSTTTSSEGMIAQLYDKAGGSLHVLVWEGHWYTYVETTTTRSVLAQR